jgi:hypothetical protein
MAEKTLEDCAETLEGLWDIKGVPASRSLRCGRDEIPIMLIGNLNNTGNTLARVTDRINEIVQRTTEEGISRHMAKQLRAALPGDEAKDIVTGFQGNHHGPDDMASRLRPDHHHAREARD